MFGKMKARCNFIVLLLGFLAACTRPSQVPETAPELEVAEQSRSIEEPSKKLVTVNSLMWLQPDSALALLLPWFDSAAAPAEYDLHYAHLLLSELLYKNYCEQTNRVELLQSEAYFDSISLIINNRPHIHRSHCGPSFRECGTQSPEQKENLAFLAARAHYMDGVGHYECDSLVPACREYLKALGIMEGRFDEKDLTGHRALFMAYAYSRLMEVFSDLYLHEQAICFARHSLEYYQRLEVPSWYKARILSEIGAQYDMMDVLDSASFYNLSAAKELQDDNCLLGRDIYARCAYLNYRSGEDAKTVLNQLFSVCNESESEKEYLARCLMIGDVFFQEQQFDSAWTYFHGVYEKATSIASKKQSAERLVDICKLQDRFSDILEYANYLVPFATIEENQSEEKSLLTELYKDFETNRNKTIYQKHEKENQRITNKAIGLLLIAIVIIAVFYIVNKKRHKHLVSLHKETELLLESEQQAHQIKQAALSGRLKRSNQQIRELKDLKQQEENSRSKKRRGHPFEFKDEPIYHLIMERVKKGKFLSQVNCIIYKEYALDKGQIVALREAVDWHYNHFTERLAKAYPVLTKSDLDYCCLYLLGLSDADISALMQRAYSTINERHKKLRIVLGAEKAISSTLLSFALDSIEI